LGQYEGIKEKSFCKPATISFCSYVLALCRQRWKEELWLSCMCVCVIWLRLAIQLACLLVIMCLFAFAGASSCIQCSMGFYSPSSGALGSRPLVNPWAACAGFVIPEICCIIGSQTWFSGNWQIKICFAAAL